MLEAGAAIIHLKMETACWQINKVNRSWHPGRRGANLSGFAQDFPGFSTESPQARNILSLGQTEAVGHPTPSSHYTSSGPPTQTLVTGYLGVLFSITLSYLLKNTNALV